MRSKRGGVSLRDLRLNRGLTMPALASLLKVDVAYLSRIETGKTRPSEKLLSGLARILRVEPEILRLRFGILPYDLLEIMAMHPAEATTLLRKQFGKGLLARRPDAARSRAMTLSERVHREQMDRKVFTLIDLFCGAGGFTRGFHDTGHFSPVWANDFDEQSTRTYNRNFGEHCVYGDINSILNDRPHEIPKADVVIGGPPCQGFSLLNKKRAGDPRKALWQAFMQVVALVQPKAFVMENVPELLRSREYLMIRRQAEKAGYEVVADVLNAADFGVPQRRKRAIIVASRIGIPRLPIPTHCDVRRLKPLVATRLLPWSTVESAIGDLPRPKGTEILVGSAPPPMDLHFGRNPTKDSVARYRCVPEGGNRFDLQKARPDLTPGCWLRKQSGGTDLFGRLWREKPAFTIRTEFFKPEKGRYLHPTQHRPITHREAARIQSFPDDFIFLGGKIEVARQIGNAVPPLLASQIATALFESLTGSVDYGESLAVADAGH